MTDHEQRGGAAPSVPANLQASPTAGELADALRSGVAVRRRLDESAPGADAARLASFGDLEGLGPVAKPGAAAPAVRFVRRVLQSFIRPWLAKQTIFNHELARYADESATIVRDLRRRVPLIEDSLHVLEARIRAIGSTTSDGGESPEIDPVPVQRMFIHSRLPPPPASVLLMGDVEAPLDTELTSLGYRTLREREFATHGGSGIDAVVFRADASPTVSLDDKVWDRLAGVARQVPKATRLIVLFAVGAEFNAHTEATLAPNGGHWRIIERLVFAKSGWVISSSPPLDAPLVAMTLTTDPPPHASPR